MQSQARTTLFRETLGLYPGSNQIRCSQVVAGSLCAATHEKRATEVFFFLFSLFFHTSHLGSKPAKNGARLHGRQDKWRLNVTDIRIRLRAQSAGHSLCSATISPWGEQISCRNGSGKIAVSDSLFLPRLSLSNPCRSNF